MRLFLLLSFLLAGLFYFFPEIDIGFSRLFYEGGKGFIWRVAPLAVYVHDAVPLIVLGTVITLIALGGYHLITGRAISCFTTRAVCYLLLVLALGPGLLVNGVLKEYSGRARPSQTTLFGGNKHFTPAFVVADQCESNCSFVSGHASIGFFFMALSFIVRTRHAKRAWLATGIGAGSLFGLDRIIQGGHFLSDVVFCGVFVYLVAWGIWQVVESRVESRESSGR